MNQRLTLYIFAIVAFLLAGLISPLVIPALGQSETVTPTVTPTIDQTRTMQAAIEDRQTIAFEDLRDR
ncbi:MAG: hypothetical protein ABI947_18160, partial [Chloroflexota bacterium]